MKKRKNDHNPPSPEAPARQSPPPLKIGGREVKLPIIQGGMGVGISLDRLSGAVAATGGIGIIAAILCGLNEEGFAKDPHGVSLNALKTYIRRAKENSSGGVVGVNVMVALTNFKEYVEASVEAGADMIISGAGLPRSLPKLTENFDVALAPIVSSGKAAMLISKEWKKKYSRYADAIVLEGPKAGGHLGFKKDQINDLKFSLENLVVDVLAEVEPFEQRAGRKIPVIVAGGIYTGEDIYRFMKMGAAGVQMGTRFVATHECDAADGFKQSYIDAKPEDVVIIDSPVGLPGRALRSPFLDRVFAGKQRPPRCITKCLKNCKFPDIPYCIAMALIYAQRGKLRNGFAFCGSNAPRTDRIVSVQELMDELVENYQATATAAKAAG